MEDPVSFALFGYERNGFRANTAILKIVEIIPIIKINVPK